MAAPPSGGGGRRSRVVGGPKARRDGSTATRWLAACRGSDDSPRGGRTNRYPSRVSEELSTEVVSEGGAAVILVHGTIDPATCERLRDAIEPQLGPEQTIVLDLSGVTFMDSSSIRVLVRARGELTADGGSLVLRNPSSAARLVLTATATQDLLAIETGTG